MNERTPTTFRIRIPQLAMEAARPAFQSACPSDRDSSLADFEDLNPLFRRVREARARRTGRG